ncbi:hypothetical protein ABK040_000335 [Willaertia magna]
MSLNNAQDEVLLLIFFNLSHIELCHTIPHVCKQWYILSNSNKIWRFLCYKTFSNKGSKTIISPEHFLDKNIIEIEKEENDPFHFKNKFFEKSYSKKPMFLKTPTNLPKYQYFQFNPSQIKLTNEIKVLTFIPIGAEKKKAGAKKTFEFVERATKEDILEALEYEGLVMLTEMDRSKCVINLCIQQDKKKLSNYFITKKMIVKRSPLSTPTKQTWEYLFSSQSFAPLIWSDSHK